jgi:hypothetical protein
MPSIVAVTVTLPSDNGVRIPSELINALIDGVTDQLTVRPVMT